MDSPLPTPRSYTSLPQFGQVTILNLSEYYSEKRTDFSLQSERKTILFLAFLSVRIILPFTHFGLNSECHQRCFSLYFYFILYIPNNHLNDKLLLTMLECTRSRLIEE